MATMISFPMGKWGDDLKKRLRAADISEGALAREAGYTESQISRLLTENLERRIQSPTLKTVERIEAAYFRLVRKQHK